MGLLTGVLIGLGLGSIRVETREKTREERGRDLANGVTPMSFMTSEQQQLVREYRERRDS